MAEIIYRCAVCGARLFPGEGVPPGDLDDLHRSIDGPRFNATTLTEMWLCPCCWEAEIEVRQRKHDRLRDREG